LSTTVTTQCRSSHVEGDYDSFNSSKTFSILILAATEVEVTHAMIHGGPQRATSDGRSTSVGSQAIFRFARPVCYQNFPDSALPQELRDANPLGIWRMIDGEFMRGAVGAR
jgi:hypothetical protein